MYHHGRPPSSYQAPHSEHGPPTWWCNAAHQDKESQPVKIAYYTPPTQSWLTSVPDLQMEHHDTPTLHYHHGILQYSNLVHAFFSIVDKCFSPMPMQQAQLPQTHKEALN
jgi:hypothetical protein